MQSNVKDYKMSCLKGPDNVMPVNIWIVFQAKCNGLLLLGVYMLFIYQMLPFLKITTPYISAIFAVLALFCIILIVTMIIIYGGIQPDGKFPQIINTILKTIYGIMLVQYYFIFHIIRLYHRFSTCNAQNNCKYGNKKACILGRYIIINFKAKVSLFEVLFFGKH